MGGTTTIVVAVGGLGARGDGAGERAFDGPDRLQMVHAATVG